MEATRVGTPLVKATALPKHMSTSIRDTPPKSRLKKERSYKLFGKMTEELLKKLEQETGSQESSGKFLRVNNSCSDFGSISSEDGGELETEVSVIKTGSSFGELALLKNKLRAATIRCKEPSHFAVIERKDYKKVLLRIEQKRFDGLTNFLQSLPYFSDWARHSIAKL